jgi:hypothetical protein
MAKTMTRFRFAVGVMCLLVGSAGQAKAGLTFYSDSTSFEAGVTGTLLTQNFNSTSLSASGSESFTSPLNATQTGPLNAGSVLAGLSIISSSAPATDDLALFGPTSFLGSLPLSLANFTLVPNFGGALIVDFSPAVTAASLDLVSLATAGIVDVSVFSTTGTLLGTTTVNAPDSGAGQFFGVTSSGGDTIGSLSFASTVGLVGLEQVQFNVASVPEPSSWFLLAVGGIGAAIAGRRTRLSRSA